LVSGTEIKRLPSVRDLGNSSCVARVVILTPDNFVTY